MSPDRLFAAIKQEMLRNKKKSAILGVMCLVAAYFWVPLVWNWVVPDGADEDSLESPASADFVVAAETPAEAASPETPVPPRRYRSIPWDELLRRIADDPHMAPAELAVLARSPFSSPKVETESPSIVETNRLSQSATSQRLQLADLELELTGIVYGPRFRIATINGTEYHENDLLRITDAERGTEETATGGVQTADDAVEAASAPSAAVRYARGEISMAELLQLQAQQLNRNPTMQDTAKANSQAVASAARDAETAVELQCKVAAIHPHHVVLQFDNGTTRELHMDGARMGAGDVIQVSKRRRLP